MNRLQPENTSFLDRTIQHRFYYIFQQRFKDLADRECSRSIDTLIPHRIMLGDLMFECHKQFTLNVNGRMSRNDVWKQFNDAYVIRRKDLRAKNDETNARICHTLLTTKSGLPFKCPTYHKTDNPVMIILNCMSRDTIEMSKMFDTFTGKMKHVEDSGSLLHLAIVLDAPPPVICMLIEDSCGLALNVRGFANSSCKQPPFGLITAEKASKMSLESLENLMYFGLKYTWCLPFLWKHSVWKIVKEVSKRPNPFYRSTAHILMDYNLPYFPVIQTGIKYDKRVSQTSGNILRKIATNSFLPDRAGTGHTLLARTVELVESQGLGVGPIYDIIMDDPNGFVNAFFNMSDDVMQRTDDEDDSSDSSDSGSDNDVNDSDTSVDDAVYTWVDGERVTLRETNRMLRELRNFDIIDYVE